MRYLFLISLLVFLLNCKKDTVKAVDLGKDYFPLEIDFWQEYRVDSITFSDFTDPVSIDTASYYLKEIIESDYLDLSDETNFRLEQYKRYENTPWFIHNVFSQKATNMNFQKVEHDLRFIKFAFSPELDRTWNGNIYIDVIDEPVLDFYNPNKFEWVYTITGVDERLQIGTFTFDSCVTILQIDEENLFEKKYSKEIYAKHVGLVYKELLILETQAAPSTAPFVERAENGFILQYTISDYKQ